MEKIEKMVKLIELMDIEEIVRIMNEIVDPFDCEFPYILDNEEEAFAQLDKYGAHWVARAIANGRYDERDKWVIFCSEGCEIYSFSTKEQLINYLSGDISNLAQLFEDSGVEMTIKATVK